MNFEILDVKLHNHIELIKKLRQVTLGKTDIKIYEESRINMVGTSDQIKEIYPAQYYLLEKELHKVRDLNYRLEKFNVNMFELCGYATCTIKYHNEPIHPSLIEDTYEIDLLPPIVENTLMPNRNFYNILNDGMHRVFLSILEHRKLFYVHIDTNETLRKYPYYAFPVPDLSGNNRPAWDQVKVLFQDDSPEHAIHKRWPRIADHKSLYRNFNSVFKGVSGRHVKK